MHECHKITALVMERGGNAFRAIINKQNSTEPRVGEEIERNGEGGEGEWDSVVETRGGFFSSRGKRGSRKFVHLVQIAVTDLTVIF